LGADQQKGGLAVNIVDSCGWLEYIAEGGNASFFSSILAQEEQLLLPPIVVYEVSKRMLVWGRADALSQTLLVMSRLRRVDLDLMGLHAAAIASQRHKLHMADAILWQTAQAHRAQLYTQDAALAGLPGVVYQAKNPSA
jgi:toxin FitB